MLKHVGRILLKMIFYKVTVVLLLALGGVQGRQVLFPSNTVAVVGSAATLQCAYQERSCLHVRWQKRNATGHLTNISDNSTIYNGWKYNLYVASGCDLIIKNVQLEDFGTYVCTIAGSTSGFADLIVLQGQPSCSSSCEEDSTAEGDEVVFTCKLTGKGGGSMTWLDKRTMVEIKNVPNQIPTGDSLSRDFKIKAVAPKVPDLVCLTRFYFNGEAGRALNVPYVTCETESCDIQYSVRDIQLSPSLHYYPPEKVITCTARGDPSPTFKWQKKENDAIWMDIPNMDSSQFNMSDASSKRYRCVAMNVVRGKSYTGTSYEFLVNKTECNGKLSSTTNSVAGDRFGLGIGIGVGIGFLVAIFLAIIVFAVKLRHFEFHSGPVNKPVGTVDHEMRSSSSSQPSAMNPSIPSTRAPLVGEQDSEYASLGEKRDANEYAALEIRQKAKPTKTSRP